MNYKKKIFFISKYVVHNKVTMAGHQVFNYYLNRFCDDEQFEVSYLVVQKNDSSYHKMRDEFNGRANDFSIKIPKVLTAITYLFYKYNFIRLLFGIIKPDWYYLDPIYGFYYKKAIRRANKSGYSPDIIVFEWTEMIFLNSYCDDFFDKAIRVATEHDVSFIKLERQYADSRFINRFFVNKFKLLELSILKNLNFIVVLSSDDKQRLNDAGIGIDKIHVISPYYQRFAVIRDVVNPQIVFYGAMNRLENEEAVIWFIENVYNSLELDKIVDFVVVGAGVSETLIKNNSKNERIKFTGYVEHPGEYLKSALCMVVPLTLGGGIKIKVLEAMSCSLPVLTNQIGIEGINAKDTVSYIHCEKPKDYSDAIKLLLENPGLGNQIGKNGKELVDNYYDFYSSYEKYKSMIITPAIESV